MKKIILILTVVALIISCIGVVAFATKENEKTVDIIKDGQSIYGITYSRFWTRDENSRLEPVEGLRDALVKATGAEVKLYCSEDEITDKEIFVGNTTLAISHTKTRVDAGGTYKVDEDLLGIGGFVITSTDDRYILAAASDLGAWNAVSYFVSECIGYDVLNAPDVPVTTLSAPASVNLIKSDYLDCGIQVIMDIDGVDISEYKIVYPANASNDVIESAKNVRRYIYAMTGAALELVKDTTPVTEHEIVVGNTSRYDASGIESDQYTIKIENGNAIIAAATDYATNYAVEAFFSKYAKVVSGAYTGDSVLSISAVDEKEKMAFSETVIEGIDYSDYIRDNIASLLGTDSVPCYSDAATADKIYDALKASNPVAGDTVFVVSNTAKYCSCDKCKGETKAFLETVNKVAEKFASDNITVGVVAINETRKPSVEKIADNVRVYFAEPYICCGHAINDSSCETNKAIAADLAAWTAVASDVYVLDFTMNYHDYPSTFPNLDLIHPNIAYYSEVGVNGVLMAWEKNSALLEFAELRCDLLEAVLLNPTMSADEYTALKDTVIGNLYGDSAPAIKSYIEKFTAASADHFTIFSTPAEILPINKTEGKTGAEAYDLVLAKELANLWDSIYERHEAPGEALFGLEMYNFNKAYIESDYYLPLHSRVQFTKWLDGNVVPVDRHVVYKDIIASFTK